ncbi:MAG TPA: LacI family DNA-binding transcriptional regulator [Devosiaceae bacterium]|jgi:DNA-binding LacI/PurR family transcriptional regulator|nr:LacI family DNA-binding transcriptional regulator [Devosiaceae bacterium]
MSRRGKRLNQGDIAERLGVSVSTVSRALANEAGISPTVRDDVRQLARALGYRSKRAGSPLLDRHVSAFVPLGGATSGLSGFYFGIVEGMRSAATHAGMSLDVRLINESALSMDAMKRQVQEAGAVGLLLAGIDATDELVAWCRKEDLPVVLVNGVDPQMRMSSVTPANFHGAYAATRRLLDAGHRRIIHYTQQSRPTIVQRRRGFEAAIASVEDAVGTVVDSTTVSRGEFVAGLAEDAYDATALFLWNDIVAVHVLEAISEAGLVGRYAIIGFDDLPIASLATPRLSTMHVDREAIGVAAIRLLRQQMEGDKSVQQLELGVSVVEGQTVVPA